MAEDSSLFIFPEVFGKLNKKKIDRIISQQHSELKRRIGALRAGCPLPKIAGRIVILVDDGIATGSTMRVCVDMCRKAQAGKIVVAAAVAGRITADELRELADDVVIVDEIENFCAAAQGYFNWCDVSDRQVIEIMHQWEYEKYQIMEY